MENKYPYKWWTSFDGGETYSAHFDTREDAAKHARDNGGGNIAECRQQDFDLTIDGDAVIDNLDYQNEDRELFKDSTPAQRRDLGEMLTAVIWAWAAKHSLSTTAFIFGDIRNNEAVPPLDAFDI